MLRAHAQTFLVAAFLYGVLLVYASLVPFEVRPRSLEAAWAEFRAIPFLVLGPESRADWIANLVAYAPLAFLLVAARGGRASSSIRGSAVAGVVIACLCLAIVIEFVQIFFAPRTVSLNDLAAEAIGSAVGGVAGWAAAPRSAAVLAALSRGGRPALRVLVGLYSLAYLMLALFPYDFVIAGDELRAKLAIAAHQLWTVPGVDRSIFHAAAALGFSVVAMMPVGALVSRTGTGRSSGVGRALVAGLLLGALIEGMQALLLSGVSDVISVLARGIGAAAGAIALAVARHADLPRLRWRLRPVALLAVPPYLLLLAAVNDLTAGGWLDAGSAAAKLTRVSFVPFYYHYYTTEAVAFASAASRVAMYLPVGALLWLWHRPGQASGGAGTAALLAGVLAAFLEGGRLLKPNLHPDPTNVLIAAAAAGATYVVLMLGWRWLTRPAAAPAAVPARVAPRDAGSSPVAPTTSPERVVHEPAASRGWRFVVSVASAAAAAAGVAFYPLAPLALGLGLVAYAAVLWRWPSAWLVLLPALLPTFDLAPWSGRFFFDEADFLVLATAAVLYARQPLLHRAGMPGRLVAALAVLLAAAHLAALLRGLLPLAPIGDNAFNNYFSPYNALRVARGLGWALLLLPPLALALAGDRAGALRRLGLGLQLGLAVVVVVALRERQVFTGLLDFEVPFRVTATFASMHLGGGSIGAFLVLTLPFLALPFAMPAGWRHRLAAVGLLVPAGYVLFVTFNRAAYFGALAGFLVLLAALPAALSRRRAVRTPDRGPLRGPLLARHPLVGWRAPLLGLATVAAVVVAVLAVALPGSFGANRFERVGRDLETRLWQWQAGLALADDGLAAAAFGTGLGSYPRAFLTRNTAGLRPTTFAVAREDGRAYLRLGSGENLYFGQRIAARAGAAYRLSLSLRAAAPGARLVVPLCEKTLLYSFRCGVVSFASGSTGIWEHQEVEIRLDEIGRPAGLMGLVTGRPVELALYNPGAGTTLDIDDLSLVALDGGDAGRELLANGGFESGTDRWFFEADNLSIWRVENMALMTLFEQGWFGLAALALAVAAALVVLLRLIAGGPPEEAGPAAVLLAGLAGFLVVGIAHGLVDAPRPMALFYLVLFAALCLGQPAARPGRR